MTIDVHALPRAMDGRFISQERLRPLAEQALESEDPIAAFVNLLRQDGEALMTLVSERYATMQAERYLRGLRRELRQMAQATGDGGGQRAGTAEGDHGAATPAGPGHWTPPSDAARAGVANVLARSLLDVYRVRGGRPVGDCTRSELHRLGRENAVEARLCRLLLDTAAYVPDGAPLREWCDEATFRRCLDEARAVNE